MPVIEVYSSGGYSRAFDTSELLQAVPMSSKHWPSICLQHSESCTVNIQDVFEFPILSPNALPLKSI